MAIVGAATEVRYREICRRLMSRESPRQIAEAMGITPGTLYSHMRREPFRDMLREMDREIFQDVDELLGERTTDIQKRLEHVQSEAFDKLLHIMRYGSKEGTQLRAATEVLDRGGTGVKTAAPAVALTLNNITIKALVLAMAESIQAEKEEPVTIEAQSA